MSYESKCIRDIIVDSINRDMFLPAIQREYVWPKEMVEKLFDSIMGDYPISSFLFWKIKEENKKQWTTYEFIKDFDTESPHNDDAELSGINKDVYLVLDGQQRLTSLYIGLKGSYSYFYRKRRETKLYFNLAKKPVVNEENPEELIYEFKFLEGNPQNDETHIWYKVGNILDHLDAEDAKDSIDATIASYPDEIKSLAKKIIGQFHSRIHTRKLINYYEEKSQDYDKGVEVFVRANTGGKKLEYSDILLSTATAKWKKLNAREEINRFTDELNSIGSGYSFDKDFVMKSALFLTEGLPIQYKVKNFNKENLEKIESNWTSITDALNQTIRLINRFGFSGKNIVSNSALLPIALYISQTNKKDYYQSTSVTDSGNHSKIQKWLILSLMKGAFSSSVDSALTKAREAIKSNPEISTFPFEGLNSALSIDAEFSTFEIENLLKVQYKAKTSYLILSLLYPDRDWKDNYYHEDHIFPKSEFSLAKLRQRGYSDEKISEYSRYYNTIVNLQLLTASENLQKNAKDFDDWINQRDANFKARHKIPEIAKYLFDDFIEFSKERKAFIENALKAITSNIPV